MPASRSARSAVHHRRRRGIRYFRKAAPAQPVSRKLHKSVNVAGHVARPWDWPIAGWWVLFALWGIAASTSVAGLHLNVNLRLDSPYAPHVRAIHLVPLAVTVAAGLGALGRTLLVSRFAVPMPHPSSTTLGLAALLTGLSAAILPLLISGVVQSSTWIHAHFALSDWPLRLLQFGLVSLICFLPMFGLAFTARLMLAPNEPTRERKPARLALAIAVSAGTLAGSLIAVTLSPRPALLIPASSLPLLVLALVAMKMPELPVARSQPALS